MVDNKINVSSFEEKLKDCDVDVRYRLQYIMESLNDTSDEILDLIYKIEALKVELVLLEEFGLVPPNTSKDENENKIKDKIEEYETLIEYLQEREEALQDYFDEEYFRIMQD